MSTIEPDTEAAVRLLVEERPDLVPHLRRIVAMGGDGYHEDVPQEALDELVRRGLLVRDDDAASSAS